MPQHSIQLKSPTGRIHLLPMSEADDPNVSTLRAHPITRQFLRFLPEKFTIDDARELREKAARDFETTTQFKIVVHDENGAVSNPFAGMMGTFRLDAANNSVEIGLLVAPDLHRQGVATEGIYTILAYVFEDKKLHRAHFVTGADNISMLSFDQLNAIYSLFSRNAKLA